MAPPTTSQPQTLDQLARTRINTWIASTGTTQKKLGEQVGRNQAWMSRYLSGDLDADLETLERIARVFGHTLSTLLNSPTDPDEAVVIDLYRAIPYEDRDLTVQLLRKMAQPRRAGRKR
jgi:transcriptional regulator with XRE-family HTH domain